MHKVLLLLWIQVIRVTVALDYEKRCPTAGEWRFRGGKFNCGSTTYVCLLHTARKTFQENCDGLDYSSTGSKLIFEPFFNKALCSHNRYQPFYFSTDGNSECVYQKSFCYERGQYVFYKGSLETDTTCGCDLSSGYEFVSKPKNTCYCIPSEEDCSCHKRPCNAKDEQCPLDDDVIKTIRRAKDNTWIISKEDGSNNKTYVSIDRHKVRKNRLLCLYLTTSLIGVVILFGSLCCLYDYIMQCLVVELNKELKKQEIEKEICMAKKRRIQENMDYLEAVMNGTEVRRFVKVCVLGKIGAGKSSLVNRLLGGKYPRIKKLEGLNIVKRCHIQNSDGKWILNDDATERQKRARRALKAVYLKRKEKPLPKEETKDLVCEIADMEKHLIDTDCESGKMITGGLVECGVWDFAGQAEFYPIHQSFYTINSIYLIVADMSVDITGINDIKEATIKTWFDSVHCLRDTDSTIYENGMERLYPTIILVFTNADKYTERAFKRRKKILYKQLDNIFINQRKYLHLRKIFFLSNKTDDDVEFEKIRLEISITARKMDNWGKEFPFEWICLENLIEKMRKEKNFISLSEMTVLAHDLKVRTLDLFLRFQHQVGNILYFEDVSHLIILNPEYYENAFRCLMHYRPYDACDTIEKFEMRHRAYELIPESWISKLLAFKCGFQIDKDDQSLMGDVMEKLDILLKIDKTSKYLTCIIPTRWRFYQLGDVCSMTSDQIDSYKKTSWLCLNFEFLPPAFFHHVYAWLTRKYKLSDVKLRFKLFNGISIFDIDKSKCTKLFLIMSTDTIALQYLWLEDNDIRNTCSNICKELITTVSKIRNRYKLKVEFALCFSCTESDRDLCQASYDQLKNPTEYICLYHGLRHESKQIWLPWMSDENTIQRKLLPKEQD